MTRRSFSDDLAWWAARQPGKLAVAEGARRLSYAQLEALVERVARALAARDVGAGDVVSSQLPNGVEAMALCLAVERIGAVHNPIATIYGSQEVGFITAQAASALVVDTADDVIFAGASHPGPAAIPLAAPAAPRFLLYTSGSTADPKGALHSERTLRAECAAQAAYHRMRGDEVFVMPSPVSHVSGLLYGIMLPVWLGATSVLMPRWDVDEFPALIATHRATFCAGAPVFLQALVDHPDIERFDTSSLRVFPVGGADVPPDLVPRALELGVRSGRGFGLTEFPSITSGAGPDEADDKRAETDGRPIGANSVRIRDGEIQARGAELFLGYLDPALDRDAFTSDGWFRTGDLGTIDGDGYLTVTGRRKDVIIRSGEKISAQEIEKLLRDHPRVADVAVVAVPDERTGEKACACVVARPGGRALALDELVEFLSGRGMSRRKLPERLVVLDTLQQTASGKVDKQALRRQVTSATSGDGAGA